MPFLVTTKRKDCIGLQIGYECPCGSRLAVASLEEGAKQTTWYWLADQTNIELDEATQASNGNSAAQKRILDAYNAAQNILQK